MLSPSSSISNLSNTNSNKKFKPDTDSNSDSSLVSEHEITNKNKLLNGIMKNTELNDVTNNTNEKFNGTEQKLNGGVHKTKDELNKFDKEELMDDSEYNHNGNEKCDTDYENDCEMIDETELKLEIKADTITRISDLNGTESKDSAKNEALDVAYPVINSPNTPVVELSEEEQIQNELNKLNKLAEIDANNNSELFRSRRTALKHAKAQKLKQLQIDLKNEEAKLILLKRLYYSQRMTSQPLTQQQQLLKQQQLQQQQKAQQLKKSVAMSNQLPSGGLINGMPGQRQSIMNNKTQPNQLMQANRMAAAAAAGLAGPPNNPTQPRPINQNSSSSNLTKPNNQINTNNMQRNPSATQVIPSINRNNPTNRQTSSGTDSPVNNGNPKLIQGSGSSVSPNSAFSPKITEKAPVVSQAAVSQLVRKELEKSLAQIEFPKPPAQDIYFLPNTNNSEFLMCLGLEEVAKCVQEHLIHKQIKADVKEQLQQQANNESDTTKIVKPDTVIEIVYEYPLFCAQCNTDFTPVWRQDKNGLNLCEKCLKQLEKKLIKTEHNARLKQAFLKAVKDKEIFEKQLIAEQQKQLEIQRAQRAANPSPVVNSSINTSINNNNNHDRTPSNSSQQQRSTGSTQGRTSSNSTPNMINNNNNNNINNPGRGFNTNNSSPQVNNVSMNSNNSNNISRQQHQMMQQRRSLQTSQNSPVPPNNKPKSGMSNQIQGKPGMNNNTGINSTKTNSNGSNPNRPVGNNSGNHQHVQNQQNHSSMLQNKQKADQMQSSNRSGQTSSQTSNPNSQRQRQSMGNINNSQQTNTQKNFSSRNNNTLDNSADLTAAQLQAQAAQLQLAAAFANTPALAAFAQQQQQQQQAAILQRLMQNAGAGGFNPLQSLGLGSPASAALNYLNMFPNQRKNP